MKRTYQFASLIITVVVMASFINNSDANTANLLSFSTTEVPEAPAGDCDGYYPMKEGVTFELTTYSPKDKVESTVNHKIVESKDLGNARIANCEMTVSYPKDKKPPMDLKYETKCEDGKYYVNLETMFSELTSTYKSQGMEMTVNDGISVVPNNIAVGDKLEDAIMTIQMSSVAMKMQFTITIFDRVVMGKETLTTPAGTFDCLILSQKITTKMGKMMTITSSSKEWLSKGVGNVRSENYNKGGKLEGYTLLTKISQ